MTVYFPQRRLPVMLSTGCLDKNFVRNHSQMLTRCLVSNPPFPRPELNLFMDFRFVNIKLPLNLEHFFGLKIRSPHISPPPTPTLNITSGGSRIFLMLVGGVGAPTPKVGVLFCLPKTASK